MKISDGACAFAAMKRSLIVASDSPDMPRDYLGRRDAEESYPAKCHLRCHSTSKHCLAGTRWAVKKNSPRWFNTKMRIDLRVC